jgi:GNAT superfamily N-acetyltransferase
VIIRAPTDRDALRLASLLGELGYPAEAKDLPRRLATLSERGDATAFVAEVDSVVVGVATVHTFASIHAEREVAWLTTLVVAREVRQRGTGRAFVAAAERWARGKGCQRPSVTTGLHRADAHSFYDRLGYEHTGHRYSKPL